MKRPRLFVGLLAVLAVVVVCVVVLRTDAAEDGTDDSLPVRLALGVVYAVGAVGPAFFGEIALRRLQPARRVARELRQLEKALAAVVGGKARATRWIRRVSRNTEAWDYWAARGRARYEKVWKAERARHAPVDDPTHPFRTKT